MATHFRDGGDFNAESVLVLVFVIVDVVGDELLRNF
jgi:hypothetical protein